MYLTANDGIANNPEFKNELKDEGFYARNTVHRQSPPSRLLINIVWRVNIKIQSLASWYVHTSSQAIKRSKTKYGQIYLQCSSVTSSYPTNGIFIV